MLFTAGKHTEKTDKETEMYLLLPLEVSWQIGNKLYRLETIITYLHCKPL